MPIDPNFVAGSDLICGDNLSLTIPDDEEGVETGGDHLPSIAIEDEKIEPVGLTLSRIDRSNLQKYE